MLTDFVEVRLQAHRYAITQEIGFRASFLGQFGDVILRHVAFKEAVAAMSGAWVVHRPDVRVLPLCPLDQWVQVGIKRAEAGTAEIVDAGGNQKDGTRRSGVRPALQ